MDELVSKLNLAKTSFNQQDGIRWIPVRHHSPACAYYLLKLLNTDNPDTVLIEGSVDFNAQIDALAHHETKTPVALYGGMGFFPLCDTSPEWQALQWAFENNKTVRFIDLPIKDKAWEKEHSDTGQISFIHESRLQHSEFVRKLVQQAGCRNSDELWERWFELNPFESADIFFNRVFDYCTSARLTYSKKAIDDSEDTAREKFMSNQILAYAEKNTFVITGGFHTYALLDYADKKISKKTVDETKFEQSWLIRYSQDRLDANNGYSAGMPVPDYYERLFNHRILQQDEDFSTELILETLAILDASKSFKYAVNTAAKLAICDQALNLSQLRGHSWPGLFDTLDAIQSVLIKDALIFNDPLLSRARETLAGNKLGSVSSEQPPLPLINELYQKLKTQRFKLDSTIKVSTDISLYNNKSTARMNLLYQCQFLGLDFAEKVSGPDWIRGVDLHLRHEQWQYAWTPWVESRLVEFSSESADLDMLLLNRINKRKDQLEEKTLVDYQQFFVQLVLMGNLNLALDIWQLLENVIADTSNCDELSQLLILLMRFRHTESVMFENYHDELSLLISQSWQQLMLSLPNINKKEQDEALTILLQVQELTQEFADYFSESWRSLWVTRLQWMVKFGDLSTSLLFACKSLLVEQGETPMTDVLSAIENLFTVDDEEAYQALYAVLKVAPQWLIKHEDENILTLLNTLFNQWDENRFMQSLPELRSLFSQLDPASIERIGSQISYLNNWEKLPQLFDDEVDENQLLQAQKLQQGLIEHLSKAGLEHWINN